jgi:hypothetical protein
MFEFSLPIHILEKFKKLSTHGNKKEMKDVSIVEEQDEIKEIISEIISVESYHYGNIFAHNSPFAIHSDISDKKKTILLIPIDAAEDQTFVVFDQTINQDKPISWIYNIFNDKTDDELKEMYYDTAYKIRPCDTQNVVGCTNSPVTEEIFKHLPFTKDLYYGLTGTVWKYTPGNALLFDANRIHATGKMSKPKIGCTIQFRDSIEVLASSLSAHTQS